MYTNKDAKGEYNPLNDESDDILGLYENDLDKPLSEGSVHDDTFKPSYSEDSSRIKSDRSEIRESVDWFKRPRDPDAIPESMNFDEVESIMWRKHQLRRFFQSRGQWWTAGRRSTAYKWILVVLIGVLVGLSGAFVQFITEILTEFRFHHATNLIDESRWFSAFLAYLTTSLGYGFVAGMLCVFVPLAAGSGIPEIKAFLNGISLRGLVRLRVLMAKVVGVCFSVASGIPIGKEGPMIHIGSIIGAALSQGKTLTLGFDTSWTKFQDFRNDSSKRDFVTYGAAAGIAAAFRAPIGGVLFTLEEGASFWSTTITFRSFFCAMITMLTVSLIFAGKDFGRSESSSIFSFGQFDSLSDGKSNYRVYEVFIFALIGVAGGVLGALFNAINRSVTVYRMDHLVIPSKRLSELMIYVGSFACLSFFMSACWQICTPMPSDTSDWTNQERDLLDELVPFQCKTGYYNQLASLYFTPAETALRQLFHFREYDGSDYVTFETIPLLLFFIPYFFSSALCSGAYAPTGLFVPLIIGGAAFGRLIGHILNDAAPGYFADSGTYALIGSAALLGGMARMTISGTVIMLEAAGNMVYLLPLMVTFGAARYTGNAINHDLYGIQIALKNLPFLPGHLRNLGLLNFFPIHEIMAQPVICFDQIEKVDTVYRMLQSTTHNGFPVLGTNGHLVGLILRKTLCSLLKLKAFSIPQASLSGSETKNAPTEAGKVDAGCDDSEHFLTITPARQSYKAPSSSAPSETKPGHKTASGRYTTTLTPSATVFYDTLERNYPRYPRIDEIELSAAEKDFWLDLRPYMDTAPYSINQSASVQRCYRQFRTMGLRHMVVTDSDHFVVGMITRKDITEKRLDLHWYREGHNLQKFINVDHLNPVRIQGNDEGGENDEETAEKDVEVDIEKGRSNRDISMGGISLKDMDITAQEALKDAGDELNQQEEQEKQEEQKEDEASSNDGNKSEQK